MGRLSWGLSLAIIAVLILGIFGPVQTVHADIAPPQPPTGGSLSTDEEVTQVEMAAERVTIAVQTQLLEKQTQYGAVKDYAIVSASFRMRNTGNNEENLAVRFPLSNPYGMGDGWGKSPEIKDLRVKVDEKPVSTIRVTSPNPWDSTDQEIAWAAFNVSFPPGEDVLIEVAYTQEGYGYPPNVEFTYILSTGAGWKGNIGRAELVLRLPFDATEENVLPYGTLSERVPEFSGKELRWVLTDLEPTDRDDLRVTVVEPYLWWDVINQRNAVTALPKSGDAWGALARAIKKVIIQHKGWLREDAAGLAMYAEAAQAYDNAVLYSPNDSRWYAGYAELLWRDLDWSPYPGDPQVLKVIELLHQALELDPANSQALDLLEELSWSVPEAVSGQNGRYTLHLLTATLPLATATPFTTPTMPSLEDTPTPGAVPVTEVPAGGSETSVEPVDSVEETTVAQASTPGGTPSPAQTLPPTEVPMPADRVLPSCPMAALPIVLVFFLKKRHPG